MRLRRLAAQLRKSGKHSRLNSYFFSFLFFAGNGPKSSLLDPGGFWLPVMAVDNDCYRAVVNKRYLHVGAKLSVFDMKSHIFTALYKALIKSFGHFGGPALVKLGRFPLRVLAMRVNCDTMRRLP